MSNIIPSQGSMTSIDLHEYAEFIRSRLQAIESRNRRNLEDAVHIGVRLLKVKDSLEHGQFGTWLMSEFGMSRASATRYMQVGAYFADKLSTVDNLPSLSVAFLLAQVSTPDNVRLAVLSGEIPSDVPSIRIAIEAERAHHTQQLPLLQSSNESDKPYYEGLSKEDVADLEVKAERIRGRMKETAEAWLVAGRLLNSQKKRLTLEQVFSLAWQEYHMYRDHAAQLLLYAESYGSLPIEQVPWEVIVALNELIVDHLTRRGEDIATIQQG